jgi:hypothetical protein
MLLHDTMADAVADVSADVPALTDASRRRGLSIRRRRRALATVGTAAAASVLALGGYALLPGADGSEGAVATETPAPVTVGELSGETAPATAAGYAAALADAVGDVADGTFDHLQGDAYGPGGFAALVLRPETGDGPAGQVMINVQGIADAGPSPYTCRGAWFPDMSDCKVRELPDGDTLRTYWQLDDTEFGTGSQRMAVELISPARRLRIVVNSLNTNPWADGETRDAPVLTLDQATQIAELPWWSRTDLPVEYVEAGTTLELDAG